MPPRRVEKSYKDGRDEMNLAEFPISVLQRQQPVASPGVKLDTVTYRSSRYDPQTRQRVEQRVVLEASSRYGLPTPADENVVLALLSVAKHTHNFTSDVVHFSPRQLFRIMGWAPNSRSYLRLREVLRRLKALVIRYENSWWDIAGRGYEAEFATGVISEYELARQTSGRKKANATPPSWVRWTPHFQQSLNNGNLKKLDLEQLFSLRLPTSQRMYRFLDKRFYPRHQPPVVEMDLIDFACGHIGLTRVENVAELKRRLTPAIAELEAIGFLAAAEDENRFIKIKAGVWRVRFEAGPQFGPSIPALPAPEPATPASPALTVSRETTLVTEFYRLWDGRTTCQPGEKDLMQARFLLGEYGEEKAQALIPELVQVLRRSWPECRSFTGAVDKYLSDALRSYEQSQRRQQAAERSRMQQQEFWVDQDREQQERRRLEALWQALPEERRQAMENEVCQRHPEHRHRPAIIKALCLQALR